MLSDKIGNCGGTEEIFLLQSEYLSCFCFVIGIKYTGGWLAIKISGVDIDPGTEGDTVLNSVTFG